ncbi:hypothetical protein [Nocardia iowensis]|uniref:Uncharacterized protein n=1 Tax=Nocardia iowensis TaxID=204891 RepID=A0ABX8RQN9_NOCIO|nr:hypothetical protein [Nocardia iowensis]QXN91918.1 hypothetical protein KV110_01630 [Nocardia iowensis]
MTDGTSQLIVERVDFLPSRPDWIFVTGTLSGDPVSVGDKVSIHNGDQATSTIIKSIEIHSRPGKTTILLDADLRPIVTAGTVIRREQ